MAKFQKIFLTIYNNITDKIPIMRSASRTAFLTIHNNIINKIVIILERMEV